MEDKKKLNIKLQRRRLLFDYWGRETRDSSNQNLSWSIGLVVGFIGVIQILINMEKLSRKRLLAIIIVALVFAILFLYSNISHSNIQKERIKQMKIQAKKMDDIYLKLLKEE